MADEPRERISSLRDVASPEVAPNDQYSNGTAVVHVAVADSEGPTLSVGRARELMDFDCMSLVQSRPMAPLCPRPLDTRAVLLY